MARQSKTIKEIEKAKQAVTTAEKKHREAFRKSLLSLYGQYGLAVDARGQGGIEIIHVTSPVPSGMVPE